MFFLRNKVVDNPPEANAGFHSPMYNQNNENQGVPNQAYPNQYQQPGSYPYQPNYNQPQPVPAAGYAPANAVSSGAPRFTETQPIKIRSAHKIDDGQENQTPSLGAGPDAAGEPVKNIEMQKFGSDDAAAANKDHDVVVPPIHNVDAGEGLGSGASNVNNNIIPIDDDEDEEHKGGPSNPAAQNYNYPSNPNHPVTVAQGIPYPNVDPSQNSSSGAFQNYRGTNSLQMSGVAAPDGRDPA